MKRKFKGIWIPSEIWLSEVLTLREKVFYSEIDSLDNEDGCYANNRYFADFFGVSTRTVKTVISALCEKGFVISEVDKNAGNRRVLRVGILPSEENFPTLVKKTSLPSEENFTHITKYIYIYNISIGEKMDFDKCKDELISSDILIELIAKENSLKTETVKSQVSEFLKHAYSVEKKYNNLGELKAHFKNWIRKQDISDVDIQPEIDWFINTFNSISNRDYKVTDVLRTLFAKSLDAGFTGAQMAIAIKNLYHHNNEWHRKSNYEHATPVFLLKDDNLNRFLNLKV